MQHVSCYARNSYLKVLSRVQDMEVASLDLIKLSPRPPNQEDLDVWITCPGIKTRNGQLMSEAERVLDALKSAASSLAALDLLLYTFCCSC